MMKRKRTQPRALDNRLQVRVVNSLVRNVMLIFLIIWVMSPLVPLLISAFVQTWNYPDVIPKSWGVRAWQHIVAQNSRIGVALWNSTLIAVLTTMLSVLIGVPAGRGLSRGAFGKGSFSDYMVLAPLVIPGLSVIMGLHVFFIQIGLADTILGVVLAHLLPSLPYMIVVMRGVFANHNFEYEEQARSLGASSWRTIYNITIPSVCPGIMTGALFVFLISWGQYILTLFVGGGRVITLPILLFSFALSGDRVITAALCIIFLIPVIIIMSVTSHYLTDQYKDLSGVHRL